MSQTSQSALRIRKLNSSTVVDLEDDYGMRLTECPLLFPEEVKDAQSVDFIDEDGVDSYNNSITRFKAFDEKFKLAFVSTSPSNTHSKISGLLTLLTSNGALHDIYSPWAGTGRTRCRFKKLGKPSQHKNSSNEYVIEFSITFSIEDPVSEITAF